MATLTPGSAVATRTITRMIEELRARGINNEMVLGIMARIPRHVFVDDALAPRAYQVDNALPIGFGQTISTPEIVAVMTSLLCEKKVPKRVLEIGTGCGYQTAVLAKIAKEVYTVERIAPLMDKARCTLRDMRYTNVIFKHADGHFGYAAGGPYDAIITTAAATHVPPSLQQQLAVGGRLILPVGVESQKLLVIDRIDDSPNGFTERVVHDVRFVPLVSGVALH